MAIYLKRVPEKMEDMCTGCYCREYNTVNYCRNCVIGTILIEATPEEIQRYKQRKAKKAIKIIREA